MARNSSNVGCRTGSGPELGLEKSIAHEACLEYSWPASENEALHDPYKARRRRGQHGGEVSDSA